MKNKKFKNMLVKIFGMFLIAFSIGYGTESTVPNTVIKNNPKLEATTVKTNEKRETPAELNLEVKKIKAKNLDGFLNGSNKKVVFDLNEGKVNKELKDKLGANKLVYVAKELKAFPSVATTNGREFWSNVNSGNARLRSRSAVASTTTSTDGLKSEVILGGKSDVVMDSPSGDTNPVSGDRLEVSYSDEEDPEEFYVGVMNTETMEVEDVYSYARAAASIRSIDIQLFINSKYENGMMKHIILGNKINSVYGQYANGSSTFPENISSFEIIEGTFGDENASIDADKRYARFSEGAVIGYNDTEKKVSLYKVFPMKGAISLKVKINGELYKMNVEFPSYTEKTVTNNKISLMVKPDVDEDMIMFVETLPDSCIWGSGNTFSSFENVGLFRSFSILKLSAGSTTIPNDSEPRTGWVSNDYATGVSTSETFSFFASKFPASAKLGVYKSDLTYEIYEIEIKKPKAAVNRTLTISPGSNVFKNYYKGEVSKYTYNGTSVSIGNGAGTVSATKFINGKMNFDSSKDCTGLYSDISTTNGSIETLAVSDNTAVYGFNLNLDTNNIFKFEFEKGSTTQFSLTPTKWDGKAKSATITSKILLKDGTYYIDTINLDISARTAKTNTTIITIPSGIEKGNYYVDGVGKLKTSEGTEVENTKVLANLAYTHGVMEVKDFKYGTTVGTVNPSGGSFSYTSGEITVGVEKKDVTSGKTNFKFSTTGEDATKTLEGKTITFTSVDGTGEEYTNTIDFKVKSLEEQTYEIQVNKNYNYTEGFYSSGGGYNPNAVDIAVSSPVPEITSEGVKSYKVFYGDEAVISNAGKMVDNFIEEDIGDTSVGAKYGPKFMIGVWQRMLKDEMTFVLKTYSDTSYTSQVGEYTFKFKKPVRDGDIKPVRTTTFTIPRDVYDKIGENDREIIITKGDNKLRNDSGEISDVTSANTNGGISYYKDANILKASLDGEKGTVETYGVRFSNGIHFWTDASSFDGYNVLVFPKGKETFLLNKTYEFDVVDGRYRYKDTVKFEVEPEERTLTINNPMPESEPKIFRAYQKGYHARYTIYEDGHGDLSAENVAYIGYDNKFDEGGRVSGFTWDKKFTFDQDMSNYDFTVNATSGNIKEVAASATSKNFTWTSGTNKFEISLVKSGAFFLKVIKWDGSEVNTTLTIESKPKTAGKKYI